MTKRRKRKPELYKSIDAECASEIFEAHKEYPQLGHDGLLKVLNEAGYRVDSAELKAFLEEHDIEPEKWEVAWGHIPGRFRIRPYLAAIIGRED